jgi:hypothetical protein
MTLMTGRSQTLLWWGGGGEGAEMTENKYFGPIAAYHLMVVLYTKIF